MGDQFTDRSNFGPYPVKFLKPATKPKKELKFWDTNTRTMIVHETGSGEIVMNIKTKGYGHNKLITLKLTDTLLESMFDALVQAKEWLKDKK